MNDAEVCVVGLGRVGLPTTRYIMSRNIPVVGYDVDEQTVLKAKAAGVPVTMEWERASKCPMYVICVASSAQAHLGDARAVEDVCARLVSSTQPLLVSVESTVPLGTCRKMADRYPVLASALVCVPHRFWEGDPLRHGVRQTRVMGAMETIGLSRGIDFYVKRLGIPLHPVGSIEEAELCKIVENAFRYVSIAFAEELKLVCVDHGLDFDSVRDACNTKWNIEIPEARDGIEGHCLPKDIHHFIALSAKVQIGRAALDVDHLYRELTM